MPVADRPNLLIFNPDQWRSDVMGHFGNPAAVTPRLDRAVAEDHVSFRSAFCQNPVCTPSRCSFMSGWYPHVRGHRTMTHMLRAGEPNLLKTLKDNGYFVWWGGKNDLVPAQDGYADYCHVKYHPERKPRSTWALDRQAEWRGERGSDTYYSFYVGELDRAGEEIYYDGDWANVLGAIDFIRNPPDDQPFCIFLPLTYPHPPYAVEEPWLSMIDPDAIPDRATDPDWSTKPSLVRGLRDNFGLTGWTEDRWRRLRQVYYGMCARVDHQYGLLLDALREAGVYDDTACFCFSDHGDYTGDYGLVEKTQNTFEDCLTRVPFLVKPPAGVACQPRVSEALVELIDFPATVEALCGIEPAHDHFGKSLLPVLAGETDELRDAVFCEGGRRMDEWQCKESPSLPDNAWESLYWPRIQLQTGDGIEHTKAAMCRTQTHKYVRRLDEPDELYDLTADPQELHNRIDDPALAGVLAQLRDRLLTWYQETCDVVPQEYDRRW